MRVSETCFENNEQWEMLQNAFASSKSFKEAANLRSKALGNGTGSDGKK